MSTDYFTSLNLGVKDSTVFAGNAVKQLKSVRLGGVPIFVVTLPADAIMYKGMPLTDTPDPNAMDNAFGRRICWYGDFQTACSYRGGEGGVYAFKSKRLLNLLHLNSTTNIGNIYKFIKKNIDTINNDMQYPSSDAELAKMQQKLKYYNDAKDAFESSIEYIEETKTMTRCSFVQNDMIMVEFMKDVFPGLDGYIAFPFGETSVCTRRMFHPEICLFQSKDVVAFDPSNPFNNVHEYLPKIDKMLKKEEIVPSILEALISLITSQKVKTGGGNVTSRYNTLVVPTPMGNTSLLSPMVPKQQAKNANARNANALGPQALELLTAIATKIATNIEQQDPIFTERWDLVHSDDYAAFMAMLHCKA